MGMLLAFIERCSQIHKLWAPDRKAHWNAAYAERGAEGVGWFQERPDLSLRLITFCGLAKSAPIIDAGGGASRLADALLSAGYADLTVIDVSKEALLLAKKRLGPDAARVRWIESDILDFQPERRYALWHDRAVFHFLTEAADRRAYARVLSSAVAPGGRAVIASFAPDGPKKCSGLPVRRYDASSLLEELGPAWSLEREEREDHRTPWETVQRFAYFLLFKRDR